MQIASGARRYVAAFTGILLVIWGVSGPHFRDAEDLFSARACLPLALAIACFIFAFSAGRDWKHSGTWLAVLIAGQAATFQLMQSTKQVGYQHYKVIYNLDNPIDIFCLSLIILQCIAVLLALAPARHSIITWLGSTFRTWQLALLFLFIFLAASAPLFELVHYAVEFMLAGSIHVLGLLTVIVFVRSIPPDSLAILGQKLQSLNIIPSLEGPPRPGGFDRFVLVAILWVVVLSILLSIFSYERHPHISDEVVYLLHAGYLSQGLLALPLPPVPEAFNIDLMIYEQDRWYSAFPPGWPAMLAVGSYLGVPWLVNPLLAGLCVLLTYMLARQLYTPGTARLIVLLLCCSPWFIFLAMSFMAHIFTLACVLVAALAVARLRRGAGLLQAVLAGTMLGIISLIRPLDGLAAAALLGLWSLGIRTWRARLSYIPVLVMASIMVGSLVLPYNNFLTGDPATFPVMAYFDKYYGAGLNALGFGADRGLDWRLLDPFPGHGLIDVILNNYLNTFALNVELFGWATGSLLLILVVFVTGAARRADYQMLLVVLMIAGLHSLYWFNGGPDYGARYWFLMLFPALALTARGVCHIGAQLPNTRHGLTQVLAGILALCISSTLTFIPWRAIDKYHNYRYMRPDIRQLAQENDFSNGLVLVNGERFEGFMSAAVYNTADIVSGSTIYAWDRDADIRKRLLENFGNRRVWLVDGPIATGSGYRITRGPLSALELLQDGHE